MKRLIPPPLALAGQLVANRPHGNHPQHAQGDFVSGRFMIFAAALAITAILGSGYLAWVGFTGSKVVGCDGGMFNCGHVLTSRWSTVLGIPVSVPAITLYVLVLTTIALLRSRSQRIREVAMSTLSVLSITAALAAAWFISLQVFTVGKFCPYCIAVHSCGIALAAMIVWQRRVESFHLPRAGLLAALAVSGLIGAQLMTEPPETFVIETHEPIVTPAGSDSSESELFEAPELFDAPELFEAPQMFDAPEQSEAPQAASEASRQSMPASLFANPILSLFAVLTVPQETAVPQASEAVEAKPAAKLVPVSGGRRTLNARQWPVWGDVEANNMVVEMFDYTCSHCRNTHHAIRDASRQLGGNLAIVALPVPLSRACNDAATSDSPERADACEIAKIAIAVWLIDHDKFTSFHDWLFEQKRTAAEARSYAGAIVGADRLAQELAKPTASQYIAKNVMLYKDAGSGTVPKMIFPRTTIVGEVASGSTIANMVRQHLQQ